MKKMKKMLIGVALFFMVLIVAVLVLFINNELVIKGCISVLIFVLASLAVCKTSYGKTILLFVRGFCWKTKLKKVGKRLKVGEKVQFFHPDKVTIGDKCDIAQNAVFAPLASCNGQKYASTIKIGNGVHIGAFDRIASMQDVTIEDDVLFAAFVHITDHSHEYRDVSLPVTIQGVFSKGPVRICRGAWLAFGCHILSGVTVGENSVVAANSVVTKDVPPYTVVAGNPARIISKYDFEKKEWVRA